MLPPSAQNAQDILSETGYNLMPHQVAGVNWILSRETQVRHCGGILADDMGLGKTIQMISTILAHPKKKTLIIVPASLITQWETEIKKFSPKTPTYIHWRKQLVGEEQLQEIESQPINIIITTYGYATSPLAQHTRFDRIVCDEAHYFRNPKSVTFKYIQLISAPIRWALTGTPIQNRLGDLQTLLTYVGLTDFGWGSPMSHQDAEDLIPIYLLRRTKDQVNIKVPKPTYKTIALSFNNKNEEEFYQKVVDDTLHKNYGVGDNPLERLLRLRQSAVIPFNFAQQFEKKYGKCPDMAKFRSMSSTKLNYIYNKLHTTDKKTVVFCHFKAEIRYLAEKLKAKGINYGIISGDVSMEERKEIVARDTYQILLVQINAGGTGLNLQTYKEIYISSPHWNPSIEEQAIGRLYRIGQSDNVVVNRVIIINKNKKRTIDERIQEKQQIKNDLINSLL